VPCYERLWRNKWLCADATSFDEFLAYLAQAVATLAAWKARGVLFDPHGGTRDDYARFYTHDPALAQELGFQDERELYPELYDDPDIEDVIDAEATDEATDEILDAITGTTFLTDTDTDTDTATETETP
jgi:hypothetical protein